MVLRVTKYGEPVLRQKGAKISTLTPEIRQLIRDMLDTMRAARGIGLAAQQVGHALQLATIDVRGVTDRPSTLFLDGQPVTVETFMPVILINPQIKIGRETVSGPEGCLSFPEIYADIDRSQFVEVSALNQDWAPIQFRCGGLLARAVQHEYDHLQGILFIDRMPMDKRRELKPELDLLQAETKAALKTLKTAGAS